MEIRSKIKSKSSWPFVLLVTLSYIPLTAQDSDSEDKKKIIVVTKIDEVPKRCHRVFKTFIKELPEGWKIQMTLGEFYDFGHSSSTNKFEPYIRSLVPLDAKGKPHGEESTYRIDGRLIRTATYKNGTKEGMEKIYRTKNRGPFFLYAEIPWVKGRIEGVRKTYHPNKQVSSKTLYKKGEAQGKAISYSPEGKLVRECTMKNDKIHGLLTDFWPQTGKPRRVINYRKGEVQGVVKEYYSDGKLKREVPFKKGSMHGEEKQYEGDGTLARSRYWLNGDLVSKDEFEKKFKK